MRWGLLCSKGLRRRCAEPQTKAVNGWVGGSSGCALIFCKALRTHPVLCSVEAVLSACLTDASLCPAGLLRALHLQRPKHQRAERVS